MSKDAFKGRASARVLGALRLYLRPLVALCVALPIGGFALVRSLDWLGAPFPGFLMMENAVIPTVSGYDWPPDKEALFHSQVIAVDGTPVSASGEVYRYVTARGVGAPITYTFRKAGQAFQRTLRARRFATRDYLQVYGVLLSIGCLALGVGAVVGFMQPRTTQGRLFLRLAFVASVWTASAVFLHQPEHPLLTKLYFAAESFFPATLIHMAIHFPVERRFTGMRRVWPLLPYLLSLLLTVLVVHGISQDPPALSSLHATYLYTAASFLFAALAMLVAYWEDREPAARLRVKAILPGFVLAGGLLVFAFINNALSGGNVPMQLGVVLVPVIFVSVAYAIVRHDLFDIDRLVRQSFVYGVLSLIVIGGYGLALAIGRRIVPESVEDNQTMLGVAFVVVLALGLDPLRRAVQRLVDRAFYRTRLDYRTTISELSAIMTTLLDLHQVVAQVTRVVTDAMHLESTTLCLAEERGQGLRLWSRGVNGALVERAAVSSHETLAPLFEHSLYEFSAAAISERIPDPGARERLRVFLNSIAANLLLPLTVRGRPIGVLALGPKRSGQPFDSDDIDLLRTLANQTAIAVQNARSYQELEGLTRTLDEKVHEQTQELWRSNQRLSEAYEELKSAQAQLVQSEKMASLGQLVAGVAHELNNPVSFVHGGLSNLEEYLQRLEGVIRAYEQVPIADVDRARTIQDARERARLDYVLRETPALLRICQEGSQRIKKIVEDLRVFARADQGERALTDVAEGINNTIKLLGDRLCQAGVVVNAQYRHVPSIEAQSVQLNQVWMNLLTNAADAVAGRPNPQVDVAVRLAEDDDRDAPPSPSATGNGAARRPWVEVQITDNGAGIDPQHRDRIFEPFFTTKPIGRGTGLGLSIVYGALKSHGGTIAIDSEPGRGTTVTVRLPVPP